MPLIRFLIYLLIIFINFLVYSKEQESYELLGVITSIRNQDIYTLEIQNAISQDLLNDLKNNHLNLYSINSSNEITHCFLSLFLYHHNKKHYLHLIKIPCEHSVNLSDTVEMGDKVYLITKQKEVINEFKSKTQETTIPKIIVHPIDKKIMIYVPEDYLLFGQGTDPKDSSFNPYYFNWNLETIPKINAFYIDKYEVTNKEFLTFCFQTNYSCPEFLKKLKKEDWDKPFIYATYKDVEAYAEWTKKEIPTEWEWELAAKGGFQEFLKKSQIFSKEVFPEFPSDPNHCNTKEKWKTPQLMSVYQLKDENFRGIVGLCGNALEWTSSYFLPYPGNRFFLKEHRYLTGKFFRVLKGGAFFLPLEYAKTYKRILGGSPNFSGDPIGGFRLILRAK
jgi:hypothetical protein